MMITFKTIKKSIITLIILGLILGTLGVLIIQQRERVVRTDVAEVGDKDESVKDDLNGKEPYITSKMEIIAENDYLVLYIDKRRAEVAVRVKSTGSIWYLNPPAQGQEDAAQEMLSIVYDRPGAVDQHLNSLDDSIKLDQFDIIEIENGVRIEYLLGERYDMEIIGAPQMIKRERFESQILERIEEPFKRDLFLINYTLISLTKPYDFEIEKEGEMADIEASLFGEYRLVSHDKEFIQRRDEIVQLEGEIVALKDVEGNKDRVQELTNKKSRLVSDYQRDRMNIVWGVLEKYVGFELGGGFASRTGRHRRDVDGVWDLSREDFSHLIGNPTYVADRLPPLIVQEIQTILNEIGYTIEDHKFDHFQNRLDPPKAQIGLFTIPIEFTLNDDNLVVRIPSGEIEYPRDIPVDFEVDFEAENVKDAFVYNYAGRRDTFSLHELSVLRYFGAAPSGHDSYILVPDGSGALINIDDRQRNSFVYNKQVYGRDKSIPFESRLANIEQTAHLPVFGIKQGDRALFVIIEEGETLANIRVNLAQDRQPYNMVFPVFNPIPFWYRDFRMYQNRAYQGDFQIRYAFLEGEKASYVGMAKYYQNYLFEKGILHKRNPVGQMPLYLELIGAIHRHRPVFGIPTDVYYSLTTVDQAKEIVGQLAAEGVNNVRLRYTGWLKGGMWHYYPKDARLEHVLGTTDDLKALQSVLIAGGGELYPDVSLLQIYRDRLLDDFSAHDDASRDLSGMPARDLEFDPVTLMPDDRRYNYILSPFRLPDLVRKFMDSYRKMFGFQALSLNRVGEEINSDFRKEEGKTVDRQQAADIIESVLYELDNNRGIALMLEGGNAHILKYANDIINMPLTHSGHNVIDRSVPFMQIVLRGFIDFAGSPINLSDDYREDFLRSVETGSNLHFKWMYREQSILKGTEFNHLLGVHYKNWLRRAVELYQKVNSELGHLQGLTIIDHEKLQESVFMTTFANGHRVIVNYQIQPVNVMGITIDGRDFRLMRGANK